MRRTVPSLELLRFMEAALENVRPCGVLMARRPVGCRRQRCYSTVSNPVVHHAITQPRQNQNQTHSHRVTEKDTAHGKRLIELVKQAKFDEFVKSMEHGSNLGRRLTATVAKRLVELLAVAKQNEMAVLVFNQEIETRGTKHEQTISSAIIAASRLSRINECERIYSQYSKVGYSLKTHHALLKSYLKRHALTTAREFARQLEKDGLASEETLQIYLEEVSKRGVGVDGLIEEFEWWDKRRELGPASYALLLERLLLDDMVKYESIVGVVQSKFPRSVELEHVYLQHAIMNRDEGMLVKHVNRIGRRRQILDKRPFILAMKYFAGLGDVEALGFATGALTKSGFELEAETSVVVGLGLFNQDPSFDLAGYMEQCDIDKTTQSQILRVLQNETPSKPRNALAHYADTTAGTIRQSIACNELERGVAILEAAACRPGAAPLPRNLFMELNRALCAQSLYHHMDRVIELMTLQGHDPADLETAGDIQLLWLLREIRAEYSNSSSVSGRLMRFLHENDPLSLSNADRMMVVRALMDCREFNSAVCVLDCKRASDTDPITSVEHNGQSLALMLECYRELGQLGKASDLLNCVLASAARPTIHLSTHFFRELYRCFASAASDNSGSEQPLQLWSLMGQCKEYRQRRIEHLEKDRLKASQLLHGR